MQIDGTVKAYLNLHIEQALAAAEQADKQESEGRVVCTAFRCRSKTCSVPRHMPTTCGSRILEGFVPPYDAAAIEKLSDAEPLSAGQGGHG